MVRFYVLYVFLIMLPQTSQQSQRVVVTFTDTDAAAAATAPDWTTVVKRYGRRMVLLIPEADDMIYISDTLTSEFEEQGCQVELVEYDTLLSPTDKTMVHAASNGTSNGLDMFWNLFNSTYGLQLPMTGDRSLGRNSSVAILDSGLADYALFQSVAPGYDFVSDPSISLDGDGRDSDPTDPGDAGPDCPTPTWHGTKVTSVLAGTYTGFYSIVPEVTIIPVRVLGLCGNGYASDLTDAVVWSAGGVINGVPNNQKTTKIISISLVGQAPCPSYLQSAVLQANSLGAIIITAAGNDASNASSYFPANCKGVLVIAASTKEGTLASYSNWGDIVTMAAPGGDESNPIPVLSPFAGLQSSIGTSFSVPHVVGALVLYSTSVDYNVTTLSFMRFRFITSYTQSFSSPCYGCGAGLARYNSNNTIDHIAGYNVGCQGNSNQAWVDSGSFSNYCQSTCVSGQWYQLWIDTQYGFPIYFQTCASCGTTCQLLTSNNQISCGVQPTCNAPNYFAGCYSTSGPGVCSAPTCVGSYNCQVCYQTCLGRGDPYTCSQPGQSCYQTGYQCALGQPCDAGQLSNPSGGTNPTGSQCCCPPLNPPTDDFYYLSAYCTATTQNTYAKCSSECGAGYYALGCAGTNAGTCTACNSPPVGYYWSQPGSISATSCATPIQCTNIPTSFGVYWSGGAPSATTLCASTTCPSGTYSASTSYTSCAACNAGYYSTGAVSVCWTCSPGSFSTTTGLSVCGLCIGGTYTSSAAQSSCSNCVSGKYSTTGSSVCTSCNPGSYTTGTALSVCATCTAGTYASASGLVSCTACGIGTYSTASASTCSSCSAIAVGYYWPSAGTNGATSCGTPTLCLNVPLAGSYWTGYAAATYSTCASSSCPSGQYSSGSGFTVCALCAAGTYASATNMSVCANCASGTYTSLLGSTVCTSCIAGAYSNTTKATVCINCVSGTYQSMSTATLCLSCSIGTYSNLSRVTSCSPCTNKPASNSYYTGYGTSTSSCPFSCNAGYYYQDAVSPCAICGVGQWSYNGSLSCAFCTNKPPNSNYANTPGWTNSTCPYTCSPPSGGNTWTYNPTTGLCDSSMLAVPTTIPAITTSTSAQYTTSSYATTTTTSIGVSTSSATVRTSAVLTTTPTAATYPSTITTAAIYPSTTTTAAIYPSTTTTAIIYPTSSTTTPIASVVSSSTAAATTASISSVVPTITTSARVYTTTSTSTPQTTISASLPTTSVGSLQSTSQSQSTSHTTITSPSSSTGSLRSTSRPVFFTSPLSTYNLSQTSTSANTSSTSSTPPDTPTTTAFIASNSPTETPPPTPISTTPTPTPDTPATVSTTAIIAGTVVGVSVVGGIVGVLVFTFPATAAPVAMARRHPSPSPHMFQNVRL